jgi:NAD(P)-dependent dehydrogenase (short-subunit alcohol dehydrogenase family)
MTRLEGKVALITGGARGLGASVAGLFAREGAHVLIGDVLDDAGAVTAGRLSELGDVRFCHLDVRSEDEWSAAVAQAEDEWGQLDVLVNNAGFGYPTTVEATSLDAWTEVLSVNLTGAFLGIKAAIPAFRRRGKGAIVNTSSVVGALGSWSSAAYSVSKGGIRLLTKSTAIQYAADNIRCNAVLPGAIETPALTAARSDAAGWAARMARLPMKRPADPLEVAYGMLFLASDEASYITGIDLFVDGGFSAG